jgi:hypothetical protein
MTTKTIAELVDEQRARRMEAARLPFHTDRADAMLVAAQAQAALVDALGLADERVDLVVRITEKVIDEVRGRPREYASEPPEPTTTGIPCLSNEEFVIDQMERALLEVEARGIGEDSPGCGGCDTEAVEKNGHCDECPVDAGLDAAGLDTQERRADARAGHGILVEHPTH